MKKNVNVYEVDSRPSCNSTILILRHISSSALKLSTHRCEFCSHKRFGRRTRYLNKCFISSWNRTIKGCYCHDDDDNIFKFLPVASLTLFHALHSRNTASLTPDFIILFLYFLKLKHAYIIFFHFGYLFSVSQMWPKLLDTPLKS